jgi:fumarate hydratase class I
MCAEGKRPICQDTGIVTVFVKIGMDVRWDDATIGVTDMINEGVRRGYLDPGNVLRAAIVNPPEGARKNTKDNTPAERRKGTARTSHRDRLSRPRRPVALDNL